VGRTDGHIRMHGGVPYYDDVYYTELHICILRLELCGLYKLSFLLDVARRREMMNSRDQGNIQSTNCMIFSAFMQMG
jgi:hypothetical protein